MKCAEAYVSIHILFRKLFFILGKSAKNQENARIIFGRMVNRSVVSRYDFVQHSVLWRIFKRK